MATYQDMHIFVTGIVGRAMGSGKFEADDISMLTGRAKDAFVEHFGEPAVVAQAAAQQQPARVGAAQSFASVAQGMGMGDIETKPIDMWGGDKAYIGYKTDIFEGLPEHDVPWGVWMMAAKEGNARAIEMLKKAAAADPMKGDPKWHASNKRRVSRAKAVLQLIGA